MIYCPKCGKELPDNAIFCDRCGQKMSEPVSPTPPPPFEGRWERRWERRMDRFERKERLDRGPDYLDGVGFGVFLIAIAWVYLQYPWVWDEIMAWLRTWATGPIMLPMILAQPIFLFFVVMGAWGILEGGLRMASGRVMRGLGNIVSALGSFAIAYMIQLYGQGSIIGSALLPGFIIIIGASILLSAILNSFAWSSTRRD
jgi:hypothetical protein